MIDDVINQVRGDFEDMGIDDAILQELQRVIHPFLKNEPKANVFFSLGNQK